MTLSMYQASVPNFVRALTNLKAILAKAAAQAEKQGLDPAMLITARLAPDMFPLARQIQSAGDIAKGCIARLAGGEPPSYADTEATFAELQTRLETTIIFLNTFKPEQIDGSEARITTLKTKQVASGEIQFPGQVYLLYYALPNFYFHVTAAYVILRNQGMQISKLDYLGRP